MCCPVTLTSESLPKYSAALPNHYHTTMTCELLPTLSDALRILTQKTGKNWSRAEFFNAVIDQSLPLRATTPNDCYPVIESMGKQYAANLPELGYRRLALLSASAIKDLALHNEAVTKDVAFEPGDAEFMPWPSIQIRQKVLKRELEQMPRPLATEDGEEHSVDFMGESNVVVLSSWVTVTDDTCRVPPETIEALQTVAPKGSPPTSSGAPKSTVHLVKRTSLDGPIETAIHKAGSTAIGAVWAVLREMAINEVLPFTGVVVGTELEYTNDDNQLARLTREAVRKRIGRACKR